MVALIKPPLYRIPLSTRSFNSGLAPSPAIIKTFSLNVTKLSTTTLASDRTLSLNLVEASAISCKSVDTRTQIVAVKAHSYKSLARSTSSLVTASKA